LRDELASLTVVSATWQALGLTGALTCVGGVTPLAANGAPVFTPVWRTLAFD
jgi:hypothetical protein